MIARVLIALGAVALVATVPRAETPDAPTLRVIAGGINTHGTGMLPGLSPDTEDARVFRIALDASSGDDRSVRHWVRKLIQDRLDSGTDPSGTASINVSDPSDARLDAMLAEIARTPNAVVHIDMDLALLGRSDWDDQTSKLARIAARVAEERLRVQPGSRNSIYAHSAATMGLSRLIQAKKGHLFEEKVAASPMTRKLTRDVVIVMAEGDLPSTEGGYDPRRFTGAARDLEGWVDRGNTVIRVSGRGFDVRPTTLWAHVKEAAIPPVATHVLKHIQASALGTRDESVEVVRRYQYPSAPGEVPSPENVMRLEIPNVSSAQLLRVLGGAAGPSIPGRGSQRTPIDQLKDHIKALEPPKGGGIALRAAAELPFAASRVARAVWDAPASRIVIYGRDGEVRRVPPMDVEILSTAYRALFGDRPAAPEFSIGASLDDTREHAAAGKSATYFQPDRVLRFSKLGFVMYQADLALADIAYGGSGRLESRGLAELAGFHSLPELFPAKYAQEAADGLSEDDRVVLQSLPARLSGAGEELHFEVRNEFAVRFGRTTPVERAYADLFARFQQQIVDRVPELGALRAASRAVGVLEWIRANRISFEPGELAETPIRSYETPAQIAFSPLPAASDIRDRFPLVSYNDHGPVAIHGSRGEVTRIEYHMGQIHRIQRHDGNVLDVIADDRGEPLGVEVSGQGAAAIVRTTDGFALVHDDVVLRRGPGGASFERKEGSGQVPETNPRAFINAMAAGFVAFAEQRADGGGALVAALATPSSAPAPQRPGRVVAVAIAAVLIASLIAGLLLWLGR